VLTLKNTFAILESVLRGKKQISSSYIQKIKKSEKKTSQN